MYMIRLTIYHTFLVFSTYFLLEINRKGKKIKILHGPTDQYYRHQRNLARRSEARRKLMPKLHYILAYTAAQQKYLLCCCITIYSTMPGLTLGAYYARGIRGIFHYRND